MKNMTDENKPSPMALAWGLALVLTVAGAIVIWSVPALRYTVVEFSAEVKEKHPGEKKKVEVKKPEPTQKQIKEIAERVERKKKESLAREIREMEKALRELEKQEANRLRGLGLKPEDFFQELLKAVARKAEEVRQRSGELPMPEARRLRQPAEKLREDAFGLSRFTTPEDQGLASAVQDLLAQTETLGALISAVMERLPTEDEWMRWRVLEAQTSLEELSELLKRLVKELPTVAGLPLELQPFASVEPLSQETLEAMSAAELYDQARRLDEQLRQTFANIRASELAAIEDKPLAQALSQVKVPPGNAPDLSAALASNQPTNRTEFQAYNEALDQANRAAQAMRLGAESMVSQASEYGTPGDAQETAQAARLRSALMQASSGSANQNTHQVVNLVPWMGMVYGMAEGGSGNSHRADATQWIQGGKGTRMQSGPSEAPSPIQLSEDEITAQLLPGRKFSRNSKRQGWLYLDTWYIIGPFQRTDDDRLSYETIYPPEIRVDLDAKYPGKVSRQTGKPIELAWRFYQSNTLRITPPDETDGSVYYAYTEVYFEEEAEALIAVASDDAAKVWVNDMVVWQDTGLSAWRLDEGFRRVLFRKGYNRVLVRIENGPVACVYSILLCPVNLSTSSP
jgi:hypothetical protein